MAHKETEKIGQGSPGPGRPKGSLNKVTSAVKDMIIQSLSDTGGVDYLVACSKTHPAAYLALVGKVLPLQVTGADGGPVTVELLTTYKLPENGR